MAKKVKITGIEGKYAITENGLKLRIIGDNVPNGYGYTDGAVVYGYAIHNEPPIIKPKTKKRRSLTKLFDALMNVISSEGLGFLAGIYSLNNNTGYAFGGYPYTEYFDEFRKNIVIPNSFYLAGSSRLWKRETVKNSAGQVTSYDFSEMGSSGYSASVAVPDWFVEKFEYDVGRGGQIAFAIRQFTYGGWMIGYVSGNNSVRYTMDAVRQVVFYTGDFPVPDYQYIRVEMPFDVNVADDGTASAVIIASVQSLGLTKQYKITWHDGLVIDDYDHADCGDGQGQFVYDTSDHTGTGTITYNHGGHTFTINNVYSGSKVTVTNDFAFLHYYDEVKQYDATGQIMETYTFWDEINNCRLDLYDIDALLRSWGIRQTYDVDEYFDARMVAFHNPEYYDVKMTVTDNNQ